MLHRRWRIGTSIVLMAAVAATGAVPVSAQEGSDADAFGRLLDVASKYGQPSWVDVVVEAIENPSADAVEAARAMPDELESDLRALDVRECFRELHTDMLGVVWPEGWALTHAAEDFPDRAETIQDAADALSLAFISVMAQAADACGWESGE